MILTRGQEAALAMVRRMREYRERPLVGVVAGYWGTGKSTSIKFVAQEHGYPVCIAPTGRAALRVRELTGLHARTIHSWLYDAEEDPQTGEIEYTRKNPGQMDTSDGAPIVILDEASMVGPDLWEDVYDACLTLRHNILVVGDAFQLPPVQKDDGGPEFNLLSQHFRCDSRVMLTEVMRQAMESPIIRASLAVREGRAMEAVLALPRIGSSALVQRAAEVAAAGGVVITHRNETRLKLNVQVRRQLGRPDGELAPGEPLLVLQNNQRTGSCNGEVVQFGSWSDPPAGLHTIRDWIRKQEAQSRYGIARCSTTLPGVVDGGPATSAIQCVLCESEVLGLLEHVHKAAIHKTARIVYGGGTVEDPGEPMLHCNLGYVMTAHKAQGSEWPEALVVLEPTVRLAEEFGRRWYYTALTRARERVATCLGARV